MPVPRLLSNEPARPQRFINVEPRVGVSLALLAGTSFASIAYAVVHARDMGLLDLYLANWFHAHANTALTSFMLVLTQLNSVGGTLLLATAVAVFLARRHQAYWLISLVIAVCGADLLNVAMKQVFQRARPVFDDPLLHLTTFSFPSGHTAGSTAFYGVLACYAWCGDAAQRTRVCLVGVAVCMLLLVGLSRIYLGVHYLSDVLGAIAEAGAWLALSLTVLSALRRRDRRHNPQQARHG